MNFLSMQVAQGRLGIYHRTKNTRLLTSKILLNLDVRDFFFCLLADFILT